MSIENWGYLSYFLIALTWLVPFFLIAFTSINSYPFFMLIFLLLMTALSFSRYIYLRYNDDAFDLVFFKSILSVKGIIRIFLILIFLLVLDSLISNVFMYKDIETIILFLYPVILLEIIISLSFEEKNLEATEGDSKDKSLKTRFVQLTLGFSAFFVFVIGFFFVQWDNSGFNRIGTFADAIPYYSITFVLLVLMLRADLGPHGSSETSQKEKLRIAWLFGIKAANWKTFKTRIMTLVFVFSLIMPLLWIESEIYWDNV